MLRIALILAAALSIYAIAWALGSQKGDPVEPSVRNYLLIRDEITRDGLMTALGFERNRVMIWQNGKIAGIPFDQVFELYDRSQVTSFNASNRFSDSLQPRHYVEVLKDSVVPVLGPPDSSISFPTAIGEVQRYAWYDTVEGVSSQVALVSSGRSLLLIVSYKDAS